MRFALKLQILEPFEYLPFLPEMAKRFTKHSLTKSRKIFSNFDGRRLIDTGWGPDSFALISATIIELSRKSGRMGGGQNMLPLPQWDTY